MTGFLSKIFGGGKKKSASAGGAEDLIRSTLEGVIEKGGFDLSFDVTSTDGDDGETLIAVNLHGADEELLQDSKGEPLNAFQLFLQRAVQHHFPDLKLRIEVDSNDYLKGAADSLIEIVDDLKEKALKNGKSVYLRALPPKERKIVHQHLSSDQRVKSRSIGDGLYKKIKIYPAKAGNGAGNNKEETAN